MNKLNFLRTDIRDIKNLHFDIRRRKPVDVSAVRFISPLTAAVYPFSFPFGRKGNVRNAIELSFRPFLGERAASLTMSPQVFEETRSLTRGAVWFASKDEIAGFEQQSAESALIPAPMAFAADINGNGIIITVSEHVTSAVMLENYMPILYRARPEDESSPDAMAEWMTMYAKSSGKENLCNVRTYINASKETLRSAAKRSFEMCRYLSNVDMSSSGATMAERREKILTRSIWWMKAAAVSGVVFLLLSSALLVQDIMTAKKYQDMPKEIYSSALGETSNNPLADSLKRVRMLRSDMPQMTLESTLQNIAAAWKSSDMKSKSLKFDTLRYGTERTEIEGLAKDTASVQALRDAMASNGFTAKLGDIQHVNGEIRFTITLEQEKKK